MQDMSSAKQASTGKIVTVFSSKGFGPNELFGNPVVSSKESASQVLSAYFMQIGFGDYLKDVVFTDTEHETEFCSKLASKDERTIRRHITSLKNNNTAKDRKTFFDRFVAGNEAILREISGEAGYCLYELKGMPNVYGVKCLKQTDTSNSWIPTLLRCVWSLCKDVSRIQLVLHDKDVPAWKGIRTDDVTILSPADNSHFIQGEAFNADEESKELFNKISNNNLEIRIVFFHHTQNEIAKIVGNKPKEDEDINLRVKAFIDSRFEEMGKEVEAVDKLLARSEAVVNT